MYSLASFLPQQLARVALRPSVSLALFKEVKHCPWLMEENLEMT